MNDRTRLRKFIQLKYLKITAGKYTKVSIAMKCFIFVEHNVKEFVELLPLHIMQITYGSYGSLLYVKELHKDDVCMWHEIHSLHLSSTAGISLFQY